MPTLIQIAKGDVLDLYGKIVELPRKTRSVLGLKLPWPFSEGDRAYRKRMQKFVSSYRK